MTDIHANPGNVNFSSWGRTRSPKNILSQHRAGINADGVALTHTDAKTSDYYITENQRFLYIEIATIAAGTVVVNGFMHAGGAGEVLTTPDLPVMSAAGIYKIDISGIDKVSFTTTAAVTLFAACSTF
jgi:hypothetical protein